MLKMAVPDFSNLLETKFVYNSAEAEQITTEIASTSNTLVSELLAISSYTSIRTNIYIIMGKISLIQIICTADLFLVPLVQIIE